MTMDFDFDEEQEKFRTRLRELTKKELAPLAFRWDETSQFPWESLKILAREGYTGLVYPQELGGQGKTYVELGIMAEELGRVDQSLGFVACLQNSWGQPPVMWPDEVRRGVITAQKFLAFAFTEPGTGSDSAAIMTEGRREGDEWVINGVKRYISFLPAASVAAVTVRTSPGSSARGISLIMVELDRPGVTVRTIPEMGLRGHGLGTIIMKEVRVPYLNLLTEEGRGLYTVFDRWDIARCLNTLYPLGAATEAIELAVERAKRRGAFGRPLIKYEAVQFRLVESYIEVEMAKMLAYKALWMVDRGRKISKEAAMVKAYGVPAAYRCIDGCLQTFGASGYTPETPLERHLRDARGFMLGNGTPDIMRIIVGRELWGNEVVPYR